MKTEHNSQAGRVCVCVCVCVCICACVCMYVFVHVCRLLFRNSLSTIKSSKLDKFCEF